jgi:hypothetical protein
MVVASVMGSVFLSEVAKHLDAQDGAPHPVTADLSTGYCLSRTAPTRRRLSRSDLVLGPTTDEST